MLLNHIIINLKIAKGKIINTVKRFSLNIHLQGFNPQIVD